MDKEKMKEIINVYNQGLLLRGSSIDFVDFNGTDLKLKFVCQDKTEFLVQGKKVMIADEIKKEVEKYLKTKINNAKIIFV